MPATYAGFVDVGYLRAKRAKALDSNANAMRTMAAELVTWFRGLSTAELAGQSLDRVFWYDGKFDPGHPGAAGQQQALNATGRTPPWNFVSVML